MPLTDSLLRKLNKKYPHFIFTEALDFSWSPGNKTVYFAPKHPEANVLLLHELSHGLLGHATYQRDVELLGMERAAWDKARALAVQHSIAINEETAESHLDTYRDWLHARSTCPECTATGLQISIKRYQCPACTHQWRVNEARICALRRYRL